jgi:hypothetical protein
MPMLWRLIEWHLTRQLSPAQVSTTLGDLAEDFGRRQRSIGRLGALVWIVRETLSVSSA